MWSVKEVSRDTAGFTMVELLVTCAISSILMTLAINVSTLMRARAADAQAMSANGSMAVALSDFYLRFIDFMPGNMCNGADGIFFKKSGSGTLQIYGDAPFTATLASSGIPRPETYFMPNKDVGYMAEIATSVSSFASISVYTWNCKGSRMHVRSYATTCGSAPPSPFPDFEADFPLPADCLNYPPV